MRSPCGLKRIGQGNAWQCHANRAAPPSSGLCPEMNPGSAARVNMTKSVSVPAGPVSRD